MSRCISFILSVYSSTPAGIVQLPAIDNSAATSSKRKLLPPINTTLVAPSKGGHADYSVSDTIISVPEGGGSLPVQTQHNVISMPGRVSESSRGGKGKYQLCL